MVVTQSEILSVPAPARRQPTGNLFKFEWNEKAFIPLSDDIEIKGGKWKWMREMKNDEENLHELPGASETSVGRLLKTIYNHDVSILPQ